MPGLGYMNIGPVFLSVVGKILKSADIFKRRRNRVSGFLGLFPRIRTIWRCRKSFITIAYDPYQFGLTLRKKQMDEIFWNDFSFSWFYTDAAEDSRPELIIREDCLLSILQVYTDIYLQDA